MSDAMSQSDTHLLILIATTLQRYNATTAASQRLLPVFLPVYTTLQTPQTRHTLRTLHTLHTLHTCTEPPERPHLSALECHHANLSREECTRHPSVRRETLNAYIVIIITRQYPHSHSSHYSHPPSPPVHTHHGRGTCTNTKKCHNSLSLSCNIPQLSRFSTFIVPEQPERDATAVLLLRTMRPPLAI